MKKIKMAVVLNTKGGVGKSVISRNIAPVFAYKNGFENIEYLQVDNNNDAINYQSEIIKYKNFTLENIESVIDNAEINIDSTKEVFSILDGGGGDDTKNILIALKKHMLDFEDEIVFIVPINKNLSQAKNMQDTVKLIKKSFGSSKIILIPNGTNAENLKEDFTNIFGDEDLGIESIVDFIEDNIDLVHTLETDILYEVLEQRQTTLLDMYINNKEIAEAGREFKKKLTLQFEETGDREEYDRQKKLMRFMKKLKAIYEKINLDLDFGE